MRNSYKPIAILLTVLLSLNHLVLALCPCSLSVSFSAECCCVEEVVVEKETCCEKEETTECNECSVTLDFELEDFDHSKIVFLTALVFEKLPKEIDPEFGRELKFDSIDHGTLFRPPPDRVKLCMFRL